MDKRIIVGISGASGAPLAVDVLKTLSQAGIQTHLIVTRGGQLTLRQECGMEIADLSGWCEEIHDPGHVGDNIASGSFKTMGMIIVPASMKTVAGIANGYSDNLLLRAADVCLKERRRMVVVARETPLNAIHLRNMLEITQAGGIILPPVISCYHDEQNLYAMIHHLTGKILGLFEIDVPGFHRWKGISNVD